MIHKRLLQGGGAAQCKECGNQKRGAAGKREKVLAHTGEWEG